MYNETICDKVRNISLLKRVMKYDLKIQELSGKLHS